MSPNKFNLNIKILLKRYLKLSFWVKFKNILVILYLLWKWSMVLSTKMSLIQKQTEAVWWICVGESES